MLTIAIIDWRYIWMGKIEIENENEKKQESNGINETST